MHNVLEFVLESTFKVLDLMLKHFFYQVLEKVLNASSTFESACACASSTKVSA